MINKKHLVTIAVLLMVIIQVAVLSACFAFQIENTPSLTIIDPDFPERTTSSFATESALTETGSETSSDGEPTSAAPTATAKRSQADMEAEIASTILAGLQRRKTSIIIDSVIEPRTIPEGDIDVFIDLVFRAYQKVFSSHPEFFYLNGSINVSYAKESAQGYLTSMTVKPGYWESMADLSDSALGQLITEVDAAANRIKSEIAQQTNVPWKQLLLLHDELVRSIAYDDSQNQTYNNVHSALIAKKTLCQGYSQSFQLIAQRLGFEVLLVLGESDGVGHAWNIVRLDGKYYQIDVTFDDPLPDGGAVRPIQHVHFLRSDAILAETHTWEHADYPSCPDDGAYYYRKQGLTADSMESLAATLADFVKAIDFSYHQTNRLELLFSGNTLPKSSEVEDLLRSVLRTEASASSVRFSHQISLGVILIDIIPD